MHWQGLSFVVLSFSLASASHHHHMHRAVSLFTPIPTSLPSLVSLPLSLTPPSSSSSSSSSTPATTSPSAPSTSPSSSSAASLTPTTASTTSSTATTTTLAFIPQQSDSTPTSTPYNAGSISDPSSTPPAVALTSATITPSSTAESSASPGFFSDTGAVAGTFTAVGLIGIAGVIAVVLLVLRRRHSRAYQEDMEYLDKSLNRSSDPPMNPVTSMDDGFTSDHGHFSASPMAVASPLAAYYPNNAHVFQPRPFSPDAPGPHGYHTGYTQDFTTQHVYSPDDYGISYPPSAPHVQSSMPNPHEFSGVELASAPVPPAVLRPSARPTQSIPRQWENTRFSVDSFYAGIATDHHPHTGQAL